MAGGVVSHAKLKVSASGTQGVAKQLDQVGKATVGIGRAQTRMGQASASAGRAFSAQANGLGGLVAAYAGAAANIFAVTAAFAALSQAAKFEQVIAGTNALASSIGANGRDIINSVNEITKSQLNLLETAQTVNIGLAAGFNTTQIEKLSDVSLRASKALGRSLTDAFTRVSRGAAKLEPELLDELGIFTRIDPAVRKYADSVGRSASSLTNFERRQAFANAVIEEGTRKFRDVDVSTKTTAESFEKLAATVVNLGLKFGSLLAVGLAPIADFISGNLSNAIAAFGILAGIVGSKAGEILAGGLNKFSLSITRAGESAATFVNRFSRSFSTATAELVKFNEANTLVIRSNSQVAVSLNQKLVSVQADIAAGKIKTKVELQSAQAVVQSAIAEGKAALARSSNRASKLKQIAALRILIAENNKLTAAVTASSVASNVAAAAATKLAGAIGLVGAALSRIVGGLLSVVTYVSLAQLALDALAKAFGFDGFNILETLLGFLQKIIRFFTAFSDTVAAFSNSYKTEMIKAAESTGAFGEELEKAIKSANKEFQDLLRVQNLVDRGLITRNASIRSLDSAVSKLAETSPAAAAALQVLNEEFKNLGAADLGVFQKIVGGLVTIGDAAGLSVRQVREFFQNIRGIEKVAGNINTQTGILSVTVGQVPIVFQKSVNGVNVFKTGFLDLATALASGSDKINDFYEQFAAGTLDAEKAAAAISAIGSSITSLNKQRDVNLKKILAIETQLTREAVIQDAVLKEKLETQRSELESVNSAIDATARRLTIEQDIARVKSNELTELERVGKALDKIYGKPGEKIERFTLTGQLGADAELARTARVREANAAIQLQSLVLAGKEVKQQADLMPFFEKRKELTEEIRQKNKLLEESAGNRAEQERISLDLQKLRKDLSEQEEKIGSENLQILKNSETALRQLTLLQERLVTLADEVTKEEGKLFSLRTKNYGLQLKIQELKEKGELQQAKTLLKLEKQRLDNQLAFRKAAGTLVGQDKLGFSLAQGRLAITAAAEDKAFAIRQADRNEKRQDYALKQEEQRFELDLKIRRINLDATLKLIKALQANTLETTNLLRAQQGLAPLSSLSQDQKLGDQRTLTERFIEAEFQFERLTRDNFIKQKDIIVKEAALKRQAAEDSFTILKDAKTRELALQIFNADETVKLFKSVSDILSTEVRDGINGLVDSLIEGTLTLNTAKEAFRQFFYNILKGVQEAVLEQTLIKPLTNAITNNLGSMFGLEDIAGQSMEQAAAATTQAAAATASTTIATSLTTVGTSLTASSTTLATQVAAAIIPAQTALTTVGTQISLAINAMATQLQIAATTAQARIAAAVATATATSSIPFLAAGGNVKHYAGGGSNQLRDRVAAMLEPGEFVVRKEAAKMIGLSKLQQMNSGNANIFEMLGMNPVKKAGGGHPGLSDSSAAGTSGMAGPTGLGGPGPGNPGFGQLGADKSSNANAFGGGGVDSSLGVNVSKAAATQFMAKNPTANYFSDSFRTAFALSEMGKKMGMPGDIDPKDAKDIERNMDYAKKSANLKGEEFDVKQAYTKANTGFVGRVVNALAPKTPLDLISLLAGRGAFGQYGVMGSNMYSGMKVGQKAKGMMNDIDALGLKEALDREERMAMQQNAAGGPIRHMVGGGSVNTRDRVPALLEPGEFVIRRPMAKAIGGQALNQMNSTGRPPQISVNLNNSGAPKSVDVQPPKVNGDKIILDIITRDMRNNGSMRKALRRGK